MIVRKAEPKDIWELSELSRKVLKDIWDHYLKDIYPEEALNHDINVHTPEYYTKLLESKDNFIFIAEDDGKIIGTCVGLIYGNSGLAHITWLCVHPEYRRRGAGTALLNTTIEYVKKRGCHKISLYTMPQLRPAIELYKKIGFIVEGVLRRHWWKVDFYVMGYFIE